MAISSYSRFMKKTLVIIVCMPMFLITSSKAEDPWSIICQNTTTEYTQNSTFKRNLNTLFSTLSDNIGNNLFYNTTEGDDSSPGNKVYGFFMCRGDVTAAACHDCVANAISDAPVICPKAKDVNLRYDLCILRYSNRSFFSVMEASLYVFSANPGNASEPDRFADVLGGAMNYLATRVVYDDLSNNNVTVGGQMKGFGTNETKFNSFQSIYSLIQCTPDLSVNDCNRCFSVAIGYLPTCCYGRSWGRVMFQSCNIRYDTTPFYTLQIRSPPPPPPPSSPTPPSPDQGKGGISSTTVIIISVVVAVLVSLLLLFALALCFLRRRRRRAKKHNVNVQDQTGKIEISEGEFMQYDLSAIESATNNFSAENKIGEGGFGQVFKGKFPNGKEIAVKRLSQNSTQGSQEFKNEVILVSKLQHRCLVRLVGFCLEKEEKILIYEFVQNKSLDHFLFVPERQQLLDWATRYKIIKGIAQGILYLHEDSRLRIIHRDLKASNVLLDGDMNPKVTDFGLAKLCQFDQSQGNTSVIAGTFGYMPPEYLHYGHFSIKLDVFSFGVLLLEIISGKRNTSFFELGQPQNLPSYAWKLWNNGTPLDLVDPVLENSFNRNEMVRCIHIGLLCVQEEADDRPTMASVVLMLNSHTFTLTRPRQPAFFVNDRMKNVTKTMEVPKESSNKSIPPSENEASITELDPR